MGPKQAAYLARYEDNELYRVYSTLKDEYSTSQGAESAMNALLQNKIRCIEPQAMVQVVLETQRNKFYRQKQAAESCDRPVPPRIEARLAAIILKARFYNDHVDWVEGTNQMEAKVMSKTNPGTTRLVVLSANKHTPPACCAFAQQGNGFPCYHGAAALVDKHGAANLWKFIHKRHLTSAWKEFYKDIDFFLPEQAKVDAVIHAAKQLVLSGKNLQVPKAIVPPRGRPVKDAGTRKRSWYETGQGHRKRAYRCGLCSSTAHRRENCPLRQMDDDEEIVEDAE